MKITNDTAYEKINTMKQSEQGERAGKSNALTETMGSYLLDLSGNQTVQPGTYQKETMTMDELSAKMGLPSQELQKMYMAVMSNTASEEDFARMMEDGYQVSDIDIETSVTILDQIKVELAKAGTEIEGYTDSVDSETLKDILGSATYAQALEKGLEEPAFTYMLKNELEPTAENIYKATYSAGKDYRSVSEKPVLDTSNEAFIKQINQVIEAAGLEVTEEHQEAARFIIEHDIPLTEKTLQLYQQLEEFKQPLDEKELIQRIKKGLSRGSSASEVNLAQTESVYEQATRIMEEVAEITEDDVKVLVEEGKPIHLKNLKIAHKRVGFVYGRYDDAKFLMARKAIEEVRLHMSLETNLRLLRKGIEIDVVPMQELLGELEQATQELAEMAISEMNNITEKVHELQAMPMQVLGYAVTQEIAFTIEGLHAKGVALQANYAEAAEAYEPLQKDYMKAAQKYEQLQTSPRADMGDSIKKAFRNVDDILADMGKEPSEENRRAVRILGYNQIEITEENLHQAMEADEKVQKLFKDLKPGRVLQLIREGVDVLHTDITELDEYITTMEKSFVESSESYAKFLQKLEKTDGITEDERESFIGIYRLVRQVEKSDGAAMGYVMASSAELTLENLLSAVRSDKRKQLDYILDDSFAGVDKVEAGKSITDQIQKAFGKEQAVSFLEQFHQQVTLSNLISANNMMTDASGVYRELAKKDSEEEFERYCDEISESMTDESSLQSSFERLERYTSVMLEKVMMNPENTLLDVRAMQSMFKQIRLTSSLAKESYYQIPVKLEEDYTVMNVHVKHTGENPSVEIEMDYAEYGHLKATYLFDEDGNINSNLQGQSGEAYALLENVSKRLEEAYTPKPRGEKVSARELCQIAKIFLQTIRNEY